MSGKKSRLVNCNTRLRACGVHSQMRFGVFAVIENKINFGVLHKHLFFAGLVVLAGEFYPIPFRTRPSKPPAPMVLRLKSRESRSLPVLPRTDVRFHKYEEPGPARNRLAGLFRFTLHALLSLRAFHAAGKSRGAFCFGADWRPILRGFSRCAFSISLMPSFASLAAAL
jgi:hypothetical protein